jgi:hypothetical protein
MSIILPHLIGPAAKLSKSLVRLNETEAFSNNIKTKLNPQ